MNYDHKKLRSLCLPKNKITTTLFSDEEEDEDDKIITKKSVIPSLQSFSATFSSSPYMDPLYLSSSYHIHQAEMALFQLKLLLNERTDPKEGWKKALKHKKSGVFIYMKSSSSSSSGSNHHHYDGNNSGNGGPIFKGEAVFKGFTPHSIFYVIGMRKLWDEQYEDGNLVENLNDTTSLTYEVCKSTHSSKPRDLCLVEKIECTHDGTILFAASSVETPKVPRVQDRHRSQIKLMGWALEPISNPGSSTPITRVTYIIQEPVKGWMSGLNKKSIARRPLIIALVHDYLKSKAERVFLDHHHHLSSSSSSDSFTKRPSVLQHSISSCINHPQLGLLSTRSTPLPHSNYTSTQDLSATTTKKQTTFTNNNNELLSIPKTIPSSFNNNITATLTSSSTPTSAASPSSSFSSLAQPIYPFHRHLSTRNDCITLLKQLYYTLDGWQLEYEEKYIKTYIKNYNGIFYTRIDAWIHHDWHPEQLCSFLHNVDTRKHWDRWWKNGFIKERFSQKDYLVHWVLGDDHLTQDISAITYIDSDNLQKKIFMASKSVEDDMIPENDYQRTHIDLYGWVFSTKSVTSTSSTKKSSLSSRPMTQLSFITDSSSLWAQKHQSIPYMVQSIQQMDDYLSTYGCPPYIRRVSGKVIQESFNPITCQYQLSWLVKHHPPAMYHNNNNNNKNKNNTKKQQQQQMKSTTWCTDIRIDMSKMYLHGYHIDLSPKIGTKLETDLGGKIIKIFTTDPSMDGKCISMSLSKENNKSDQLQLQQQQQHQLQPQQKQQQNNNVDDNSINKKENTNTDVRHINKKITDSSINHQMLNVDNHEEDIALKKEPTENTFHYDSALSIKKDNYDRPTSLTAGIATIKSTSTVNPVSLNHVTTCSDTNIIQIPKDYILIPQEYQHHNIINITNELTFNAQQLILMVFGMIISYYMGKLASSC
ncbi:hypothetical protein BJ944DRAFT_201220 [Cunninghamella echinulata]|nr:hypothetical protein BJ944DRAFT_201220 [Cunninghamella echinulata]